MSQRFLAGASALASAVCLLSGVLPAHRGRLPAAADKEPPAKETPGKDVFGMTKVWSLRLTIPGKEYEAMQPAAGGFGFPGGPPPRRAPRDNRERVRNLFGTEFAWVQAELMAAGKTYKKLGIRYSGEITYLASSRGLKRPLALDFSKFGGQRFHGLTALHLHAMPLDPARARERTFARQRTASVAAQLAGRSKGYVPRGFGFGQAGFGRPGGGPGFGRPSQPIDERTFRDTVRAPAGFDVSLFAAPPKVSYPVALAAAPTGELFVAVDEQGSIGRTRTIQKQSLMPEGLAGNLTPEELADLIAYLQSLTSGDTPKTPAKDSGTGKAPASEPVKLTAQEDHRRMLNLLKIKSLRRGPSGNPRAANAANYDEAKANPYPQLPDPLVLKSGKKVTTAEVWWKQRRPQIVEDFDREVYGRVPKETPRVKWEVTDTRKHKVGDREVVTKQLVGHVDNSAYPAITVAIRLTLTTPADARGPVPVIMEFGFGFGRGRILDWQKQVIARGWGYAVIIPSSIQADNGSGLTRGIIGLCNRGQPRKPDDWGALRAWAWGASRALDYLETDRAVDAKRVGIEGLSRYGKAAIVTLAYDRRFAIGFIGSSGAGGAKLHRRHFGEQVENVAGAGEYHWMAGNYLKYAGPLTPKDLPVDAHELIALCAPRPVFISVGSQQVEGGWVDARGMFMAGVAAGPVYRLLGKKGLGTGKFPPQETPLIEGEIAFRQHAGGHTTGPNWPTFLQFAGRYFKGPMKPAAPGQSRGN